MKRITLTDYPEVEPAEQGKTFELGRGISITVARLVQPAGRKGIDSALKSPDHSIRSGAEIVSLRGRSPDDETILKERGTNKTWGNVRVQPQISKSGHNATVIDFSKVRRDVSKGKENPCDTRGNRTSREAKRLPSRQKFMSECSLGIGKEQDSIDLSKGAILQVQPSLLKSISEVAQKIEFISVETTLEETLSQLDVQWQELLARSEPLEFMVHIAKPLNQKSSEDRVNQVVSVLRRAKEKILFILRALFRGEIDEEFRVRVAAILGHLEEVSTPRGSDNEAQAFSSTRFAIDSCKALLPSLKELENRREIITGDIKAGCSWFSEFRETLETLSEAAAQEESARLENVGTLEELESSILLEADSDYKKDADLSEKSIAIAAQRVYEEQANRIKREGVEKIFQFAKNTREELVLVQEEVFKAANIIAKCNSSLVHSDLEGLESESDESILSLWNATISMKRAIDTKASPYEHAVDLRRHLATLLQTNVQALGLSLANFIVHPSNIKTMDEIDHFIPFLSALETCLTRILRLRVCERIRALLNDSLTSSKMPYNEAKRIIDKLEYAIQSTSSIETSPVNPIAKKMLQESLETGHVADFNDTFGKTLAQGLASARAAVRTFGGSMYLTRLQIIRAGMQNKYLFNHIASMARKIDRTVQQVGFLQPGDGVGEILGPAHCAREIIGLSERFEQFEAEQKARSDLEAATAQKQHEELETCQKELNRIREEMCSVKTLMESLKKQLASQSRNLTKKKSLDQSFDLNVSVRGKSQSKRQTSKSPAPARVKPTSLVITKSSQEAGKRGEVEEIEGLLSSEEREAVLELSGHLANVNVKNSFMRKLLKHLDAEFNLDQHCNDWLSRGLAGVRVRKGPKLPFGYSGSKKIDCVSTWNAMSGGRPVDLEKMGLGMRIVKFELESCSFVLLKQLKKGTQEDWVQPESLSNYSFNVDEPTRRVLWEQLGKADHSLAGLTEKDKRALKSCMLYSVECTSQDTNQAFQLVFESVRSVLSFLVTVCATEQL